MKMRIWNGSTTLALICTLLFQVSCSKKTETAKAQKPAQTSSSESGAPEMPGETDATATESTASLDPNNLCDEDLEILIEKIVNGEQFLNQAEVDLLKTVAIEAFADVNEKKEIINQIMTELKAAESERSIDARGATVGGAVLTGAALALYLNLEKEMSAADQNYADTILEAAEKDRRLNRIAKSSLNDNRRRGTAINVLANARSTLLEQHVTLRLSQGQLAPGEVAKLEALTSKIRGQSISEAARIVAEQQILAEHAQFMKHPRNRIRGPEHLAKLRFNTFLDKYAANVSLLEKAALRGFAGEFTGRGRTLVDLALKIEAQKLELDRLRAITKSGLPVGVAKSLEASTAKGIERVERALVANLATFGQTERILREVSDQKAALRKIKLDASAKYSQAIKGSQGAKTFYAFLGLVGASVTAYGIKQFAVTPEGIVNIEQKAKDARTELAAAEDRWIKITAIIETSEAHLKGDTAIEASIEALIPEEPISTEAVIAE